MRLVVAAAALAATWAAAAPPAAAQGDKVVALAPLTTLGVESRGKETRATQALLVKALSSVPGHRVVADKALDRAVKKARRRDLRACDGKPACLAELGGVVKARLVVYGEVGGLGDARVVYLKVVDARRKVELRSTTLQLGGADSERAGRSAAYRLLAPERYLGDLVCNVDIAGANIYVDGRGVATSPAKPVPLSVGTHALRVTHPEYRDFVRFVDVAFDEATTVEVQLKKFPIVTRDIEATGADPVTERNVIWQGQDELPWYREWYVVAGGSALLFLGTAVVVGVLADGLDVDGERTVDRP